MKNLIPLILFLLSITCKAQTIFPLPYSQHFSSTVEMSEWTVNTPWYIDTVEQLAYTAATQPTGAIKLFSPWLNTTTVTAPTIKFELRIKEYGTECVPVLVFAKQTPTENFGQIRYYNLETDTCGSGNYFVGNDEWTEVTISLTSLPEVRYIFNAEFGGAGRIDIRNVRFDSETVLSLPDMQDEAITVYPNPAKDFVTVAMQTQNSTDVQMKLFNSLGQLVLQEKGVSIGGTIKKDIRLDAISPGTYILQLQYTDQILKKRILIK